MTTSVSPVPSTPAKPVKYKRSLRNYLLDPRFQLKWTGMIIGVAFVISAIMGVFLYRTTNEVTSQSHKVIAEGEGLIKESQKNSELVKMQIKDQYADAPELADSYAKGAKELDTELEARQAQLRAQQQAVIAQQNMMLLSLVAGPSFARHPHRPPRHLLHTQGRGAHLQDEDAPSSGGRREAEFLGQASQG